MVEMKHAWENNLPEIPAETQRGASEGVVAVAMAETAWGREGKGSSLDSNLVLYVIHALSPL